MTRRIARPLVWTRNDETPWERAIVPGQTIFGSPRGVASNIRKFLPQSKSAAEIKNADHKNN